MTAKLIDGKMVAASLTEKMAAEVEGFYKSEGIRPKLTVIIVGANPASQVYVRNKKLTCEKAGMLSEVIELPEATTEETLLETIRKLNEDTTVHGILVQLPLPRHINEDRVIETISPFKDVDAFHPYNVGRLFVGKPVFEPCTPAGVIQLLKYYQIQTAGKHVVIIGRSNIVGKPLAALFLMKGMFGDATVTICHSKTQNLEAITQSADILIAAIGVPEFVRGTMIRPGAVVIDVGINRIKDDKAPKGVRLVGDVQFEEAMEKASLITPVPGGVGPMTIAMLLKNTLAAAKR